MDRIKCLSFISDLSKFKIIRDENGTEYVVFESSSLDSIEKIDDKTAFEAVENHIHMLDGITKKEFDALLPVAESLGRMLLCSLKQTFPDKHFVVFVSISIHDSFIIRFHQKWSGEEYYYDPSAFDDPKEKIFMFED